MIVGFPNFVNHCPSSSALTGGYADYVYDTVGSHTFTVPVGAVDIYYFAWGGGGGGGSGYDNGGGGAGGGGGGGGGFATDLVAGPTPGDNWSLYVGDKGIGSTNYPPGGLTPIPGTNGEDTTISTLGVTAYGGGGAHFSVTEGGGGAGTGGTHAGDTGGIDGDDGAQDTGSTGGDGGDSNGTVDFPGGAGGSGSDGNNYGGGGAGGNSGSDGYDGAIGRVIFRVYF